MWIDNDKILAVFDGATNKQEGQFPHLCPICNNRSAHIYVHQHGGEHCGIWVWCNSCNSFSHMSGVTPDWWENPEFVDENQLCTEPEYLNEISDKIDKWVNNIIPSEGIIRKEPFTMVNEFKAVTMEDFQGIPKGTVGKLIIKDDFKTLAINFVNTEGKAINLSINPENVADIFKIID